MKGCPHRGEQLLTPSASVWSGPEEWLPVQAAKLKHQLTYEQRRNLQKDVEAAQADLEKIQDNLERLQAQADAAAEASAALEDTLSAEVRTAPRHQNRSA